MINAKLKPDWAGEDFLSQIVNVLIKTKPLYSLMKLQARKVLIKTAEKNGVQWRKICQELDTSEAKELLKSVTNPNIKYPDYYQVPFHAYDEGNLCPRPVGHLCWDLRNELWVCSILLDLHQLCPVDNTPTMIQRNLESYE